MDQFARVVLGYHGCNTPASVEFARRLFDGTARISDWEPSENVYDWLGRGIYFWEHGPQRAQEWAGKDGTVIGAVIQLGRCFDLTDVQFTGLLRGAYESVAGSYAEKGVTLPTNRGPDWKLRELDCLVIDRAMYTMDKGLVGSEGTSFRYQTVRAAFEEGDEAFPGSMLKTQTHIQLSVRDARCILGVFRPNI